jgi:hypothetical protein
VADAREQEDSSQLEEYSSYELRVVVAAEAREQEDSSQLEEYSRYEWVVAAEAREQASKQ